jgi:transposase
VLAKMRARNRVRCVAQTMVYVLNVLSEVAPDWVRASVPADWVERYGERLEHERLPQAEHERKQDVHQVGADGWALRGALDLPPMPDWRNLLPASMTVRRIWAERVAPREQGGGWRAELALPAGQLINSPYDLEARSAKKRSTLWVGYKVHCTQTCDEEAPQLITHVETALAPVPDERALASIHASLAAKELLPASHLVDAGYVDAVKLVQSWAAYEVDLVGPTLKHDW